MDNPYAPPASVDAGSTATPRKERFGLLPWAWAIYALGVVVILALQPFQATGSLPFERLVPFVFGKIFGLTIISLLPSLLVFYLSGRSKKAASITFAVLVVFCTLGQVGEVGGISNTNTGQRNHAATHQPGG